MLKLTLISAAALSMMAGAASATTSVSFSSYQTALNAGDVLYTNFDAGLPSGATGTGALITGSTGASAAPALSATTVDATQYLTIAGGVSETFDFGRSVDEVSIYVGSLDGYNTFSFNNGGGAFSGGDMAISGAVDSGNQQAGSSNGRLTFDFTTPVSSLTLSSASNALEISNIAISAAPEPSIWMLMIAGVAMIGGALRLGRRRGAGLLSVA